MRRPTAAEVVIGVLIGLLFPPLAVGLLAWWWWLGRAAAKKLH